MRNFKIVRDEMRKNPNVDIQLPTRATKDSMAYDIYSPVDIVIPPKTSKLIWTDVKVRMNTGEGFLINVRSSMGKHPVMLANTQGWIDGDYYDNENNDGNIGVNLYNLSDKNYVIKQGDRIAQGMFVNYLVTDNDNASGVRIGGFGSTNKE